MIYDNIILLPKLHTMTMTCQHDDALTPPYHVHITCLNSNKNECPKIVLESVYTNISVIFHLCKVQGWGEVLWYLYLSTLKYIFCCTCTYT